MTAAAFMLLAGAVAVIATVFRVDIPLREKKRSSASTTMASSSGPVSPKLNDFSPLWSVDLRRPLYDPPPKQVVVVPPPPPKPLNVHLVGTAIEPGHSAGMFIMAGGQMELKAVGELIDDAQLLDVNEDSATLLHNGSPVTIKLEKTN